MKYNGPSVVLYDGEGSTAEQIQTCNRPGRVGLSTEHIRVTGGPLLPAFLLSHDARIPDTQRAQLLKNEHFVFFTNVLEHNKV